MHSVSLKESKVRQDNLDLEIRKKLKEQKQKKKTSSYKGGE